MEVPWGIAELEKGSRKVKIREIIAIYEFYFLLIFPIIRLQSKRMESMEDMGVLWSMALGQVLLPL